jgi:hypothetical protein
MELLCGETIVLGVLLVSWLPPYFNAYGVGMGLCILKTDFQIWQGKYDF